MDPSSLELDGASTNSPVANIDNVRQNVEIPQFARTSESAFHLGYKSFQGRILRLVRFRKLSNLSMPFLIVRLVSI